MKDSFYKLGAVSKCLNKLFESSIFEDLIWASNLSDKDWNELVGELKITCNQVLRSKREDNFNWCDLGRENYLKEIENSLLEDDSVDVKDYLKWKDTHKF